MQCNVRGGRRRHGRTTPSLETRPTASILPWPRVSHDAHQHTGQRHNPEALFQSFLRRAVLGNTRGVIMSCLDQLRHAAEAGQKESMYTLSLFLYRPNNDEADHNEARRLLRLVEGPREGATTLPWKKLTCTKRRSWIIASTCDCRVVGAGARTSPRRFAVCGSRVWRPRRMACLVLVA
jgi:hypothetical protein